MFADNKFKHRKIKIKCLLGESSYYMTAFFVFSNLSQLYFIKNRTCKTFRQSRDL